MKTILVIREFDNFSRILAENGFEAINLLLTETKPLEDLRELEAKLADIGNYDGIFITSRHAAQVFRDNLPFNYRGKVYVLGKRSYEILRDEKLNLIYDKSANTARDMLENILPEYLKGKKFLFVCGEKSLRIVPDFLAKTSAVDEIIVYEAQTIAVESDKIISIRRQFEKGEISAACFFSPSGASSFIEQFGADILHQTTIAAIGKTTAEFFEQRYLEVDFVSSKSNAEDFAVELIEYLRERN